MKPLLFIPAEDISSLTAGRGGGSGNTRYVDLKIETVDDKEYEFTNIERDELPALQNYVKEYLEARSKKEAAMAKKKAKKEATLGECEEKHDQGEDVEEEDDDDSEDEDDDFDPDNNSYQSSRDSDDSGTDEDDDDEYEDGGCEDNDDGKDEEVGEQGVGETASSSKKQKKSKKQKREVEEVEQMDDTAPSMPLDSAFPSSFTYPESTETENEESPSKKMKLESTGMM